MINPLASYPDYISLVTLEHTSTYGKDYIDDGSYYYYVIWNRAGKLCVFSWQITLVHRLVPALYLKMYEFFALGE